MKVLYLRHIPQLEALNDVAATGIDCHGWRVGVLCEEGSRRNYSHLVKDQEDFFYYPDFSKAKLWEICDKNPSDIDSYIEECEQVVGLPVSRMFLAAERDLGRAYSKPFFYWPENELAYNSLKSGEFPHLIKRRMFFYLRELVRNWSPELVIGGVNSDHLGTVLYFVAKHAGIPFCVRRKSQLLSQRHYWTTAQDMFNEKTSKWYQQLAETGESPSEHAVEKIQVFSEKLTQSLQHIEVFWSKFQYKSFVSLHGNILQRVLAKAIYIIKRRAGKKPKPIFPAIVDVIRQKILRRFQRKYYTSYDEAELQGFKYIYFPLHVSPELVLNVQATACYDQWNNVRQLSYNLPQGYKLLVRAHRFNTGRRPTPILKNISVLPGTVLLDAYDDQYKYLKHADMIVTVKSSTGMEGLMLGKPVLTLDDTAYDAPGLAYKLESNKKLGPTILSILNTHSSDPRCTDKLALLYDAEYLSTIANDADPKEDLALIASMIQ